MARADEFDLPVCHWLWTFGSRQSRHPKGERSSSRHAIQNGSMSTAAGEMLAPGIHTQIWHRDESQMCACLCVCVPGVSDYSYGQGAASMSGHQRKLRVLDNWTESNEEFRRLFVLAQDA